jgi:hypothetical protein
MKKYALLFVAGMITDDKREENNKAWTDWLAELKEKGALVEGYPFGDSKVVYDQTKVKDYDWQKDSNVGGYCIIQADSLDDAVELSMDSPQLMDDYGSGMVEVRELLEM